MDTSETYIKMCEKAAEIQVNIIKPTIITFFDEREHRVPLRMGCDGSFFWAEREVWLPRQDQLQEMFPKQKDFYSDVIFFRDMIRGFGSKFLSHQADSWEQLWLILVIRWEYNKVWNGDDWVGV